MVQASRDGTFAPRRDQRIVVVALAAACLVGCGSDRSSFGSGLDGGDDASLSDASLFMDSDPLRAIEIRPADPVLTSSGATLTQKFEAFERGGTMALAAAWSLDDNTLGLINASSGVFTASGTVGGISKVTARIDTRVATTMVTVRVALVDTSSVSAGDQALLKAGGPLLGDTEFKWLYPYDATVFPRGLRAPSLQFGGVSPDKVYVHVESKFLTYDAFLPGSSPGRVVLPEDRWKSITASAGGSDKVTARITKMSGGVVVGPITEHWTIAQGSLKGTVYYNTYSTPQGATGAGALLKVRPGSTVDAQVFLGNCTVCHTVSANGNVVASGLAWSSGNPTNSGTFAISGAGVATPAYSEALGRYAFGGLTPNGKYMMSNEVSTGDIRGLSGPGGSSLYSTGLGLKQTAPGWDQAPERKAQMPSFSPDGKYIVFNNRDTSAGHTLTVMGFDEATLTFSGTQDIWTDNANLLAWPAFLPDSKAVVFHAGPDLGTQNPARATDIQVADVASKQRFLLPALNGFVGTDTTNLANYLPYGEAAEGHLNYEPTVLPVAAGGYYWVIFTSRRCYGNTFTSAQDPFALSSTQPELSPRKKLWVAAIDLSATPGQDRSHPAFYLPGQELNTGNMRAFWALDPCKTNGDSCETGDECCGGYCRQATLADGAVGLTCKDKSGGCAQEFEKCTTSADCCGASAGFSCINQHCAKPAAK